MNRVPLKTLAKQPKSTIINRLVKENKDDKKVKVAAFQSSV